MPSGYEKGVSIRREVLGGIADGSSDADDFTAPLRRLVTEYCWGDVWARPGLDRRSRSILNLGMLTALNRPDELRLHVRGAINNGLTEEEICEVLLQTAVYCGVPAAIDSFRIARDVLRNTPEQDNGHG